MSNPDDFETPRGEIPRPPTAEALFVRRMWIVALFALFGLVLWQVSVVLILVFGGILVAVILRNASEPFRRYMGLSDRLALAITTVILAVLFTGFFWVFGAAANDQYQALVNQIPGAFDSARAWLNRTELGRQVFNAIQSSPGAATQLLGALPVAGGIIGGLGEIILVIIVGIYFAIDPPGYVTGVLRLVPPRRRARARETLDAMGEALRKWLIGMSLDMLLLGAMIWIGMTLIGAPLPLALAVLSGIAVFVPYIGPIIATLPGLFLALSVSPREAAYAAIVYFVVLMIEGNLTQPLLQRWAVALPPVVNLLAILVFAPLFGIWGAVLATPLSVALWVLVQKLYIEDVLDDR